MADLTWLCQQLTNAPMFPVDNIADYLDLLAPALVDHASYRQVRDALDDAAQRVAGHAAKADRARTRCLQFLAANQLLEALAEIHEVKINWWQGDTLRGAILAMLLAAAVCANTANQPDLTILVPRCLSLAATYGYQAGSWLTATHTFRAATLGQGVLIDDPGDLERHTEFATMLTHQTMIARTARDLRPALMNLIETVLQSTGIDTMVESILEGTAQLAVRSEADWARIADEGGGGRPFSDTGPIRRYTWAALGMTWTVTATNQRAAVLAAERFTAAAQVILAELATDTAVLLPGHVHVEVRPDAHTMSAGAAVEPVPDHEASRWIVHLTPVGHLDLAEFPHELGRALIEILLTNSLLPTDQFMDVINRAFERGLMHKLIMGRPYDETAALTPSEAYPTMAQALAGPVGADVPIDLVPAADLRFPTQPGPGYDRQTSLELVRDRYRNCAPIVQYTLPRIINDPGFRTTINQLRDEGWRDWHILVAMANHVANHRLKWEGINLSLANQEDAQRAMQVMQRPERPNDPKIAAQDFSEQALRFNLHNAAISTVRILGLQTHQQTPNLPAILSLLGAQYGYWTDDVDHDDIFHWSEQPTRP